jgi:superfamily II DNA or RNA helicase
MITLPEQSLIAKIKLRPYQSVAIFKVREKLHGGTKKLLVMSATGSGKTAMMSTIVDMAIKKGSSILTVMYGSDLVRQTAKVYEKYYGTKSKIIMGATKSDDQSSIVGSISTLNRRNLPDVDIVLIDEAHNKYDKILEHYKDKIIIAFSATPFVNCHHYEDYILVASIKELIKEKHLVQPRHFAPKVIDTTNVKTKLGDYDEDQLAFEALKITGDIVNEWIKSGKGRPTIAFCVNIKHSIELAESFKSAGIRALHLDASASPDDRDNALSMLKHGELEVLTNVMIFTTGIDLPEISCVIHARPTKSEVLYIQSCGRALRPCKGKTDCIILDHAHNWSRFGLLTDDRLPVITAPEKKKSSKKLGEVEIKIWVCTFCYCTNSIKDTHCMECKEAKPVKEKKVATEDGELQEITESKKKNTKIFLGDVMPFGKHRGTAFEFLPYQYIEWGASNLDNKDGLQMRFKVELQRRNA